MTQEIQLRQPSSELKLETIERIGTFFAKSGMFGCERSEQGSVLALQSWLSGSTPFEIVRTYHIIDGKLSKKALAIFAEFRAKGGKVKWLATGKDGKKAEAEFSFEGQTLVESFTIEEAKSQGLIRPNSNWQKTPANMLRARVLSNAIAMLCPEILAGVSGNPEDESESQREQVQIFQPQESKPQEVKILAKEDLKPVVAPATPEPKSQPPTIDAQVVREFVTRAEINPETGKLNQATVETLQHLIGEQNAEKAIEWLKTKNQVQANLFDLNQTWAQAIINAPDRFLAQIK